MAKIYNHTLLLLMFCVCHANRLHDAIRYLDQIFSDYVPGEVEKAGLAVTQLPDLAHSFQNRTPDGASMNLKARYHSGNLTGLEYVHRISCQEPEWTFSNLTFVCKGFLPLVEVQYQGELEDGAGHWDNFGLHKHPFSLKAAIASVGFTLEVTSSPRHEYPAIKRLSLDDQGSPHILFNGQEKISYERMSENFFHQYVKAFKEVFDGPYKQAFDRAIGSISFPNINRF